MAIRTARGFTEEVPAASGSSIGALARCSLSHSERDTHKLIKDFQLAADVPLSEMTVGEQQLPFLKMSDWARYLADKNLLYRFAGLAEPDPDRVSDVWRLFWNRYKAVNPRHEIFSREREGLDLGQVVGLMVHGDEGRSQKKLPMLIVSACSILGYGLRKSRASKKTRLPQNLNYTQSTWCTRFLLAAAPRAVYASSDDLFQDIMRGVSDDLRVLFDEGVTTLDGQRVYFCPISVMGDWPYIQKAGLLSRSFLNIAKHTTQNAASKGICHRCLADCPGWIWEDFESRDPPWLPSVNTVSPFKADPAMFILPMDRVDKTKYFTFDLFHTWHMGAGKSLLSTTFILLATSDLFPGSSIDVRIGAASDDFIAWCRQNKHRPYVKKITKETLGMQISTNTPVGGWSKGHTTTSIAKWVLHICRQNIEVVRANDLLYLAFQATVEADLFISGLYKHELWIPANEARLLANHALQHLRLYGRGASLAWQKRRSLFPLMPNHHRLHHLGVDLLEQSQAAQHCLSPLHSSCQPAEDFIGRPSRISRRVNCRQIVTRTLQRALAVVLAHYHKAGLIKDPPLLSLESLDA